MAIRMAYTHPILKFKIHKSQLGYVRSLCTAITSEMKKRCPNIEYKSTGKLRDSILLGVKIIGKK